LLSLSNGPLWKSRYIRPYIMALTGRLPLEVHRPVEKAGWTPLVATIYSIDIFHGI